MSVLCWVTLKTCGDSARDTRKNQGCGGAILLNKTKVTLGILNSSNQGEPSELVMEIKLIAGNLWGYKNVI